MAETTTAVNACDVEIWIDSAGGTPTDASGSSNAVSMTIENEIGQYRVFSNRWQKSLECGKSLTMTINAVYSTASDECKDLLATWVMANPSGARTVTVYIPDKNVGSDRWQGEWRIQDFNFAAYVTEAAAIPITATLVSDGTITRVTNAT
jgi:hypothetical protein